MGAVTELMNDPIAAVELIIDLHRMVSSRLVLLERLWWYTVKVHGGSEGVRGVCVVANVN